MSALKSQLLRFFALTTSRRFSSGGLRTRTEIRAKRNHLFAAEKERQLRNIGLIQKIRVKLLGRSPDEEGELIMNKHLSAPYDCARHLSESVCQFAALALVDGQPYDMHRPLVKDCELRFLYFTDAELSAVNKAYWRSCSLVLGHVLETAIKDEHSVELHSWPAVEVASGSFIYDAFVDFSDWKPSKQELLIMGRHVSTKLRQRALPFERLDVPLDIALKIFEENKFKFEQLPLVAAAYTKAGGAADHVPLYRVGDHVEISRGPMISSTAQLGYFACTGVHPLGGAFYRLQGVSVPFTQRINSFTWDLVARAGAEQNPMATRAGAQQEAKEKSAAVSN